MLPELLQERVRFVPSVKSTIISGPPSGDKVGFIKTIYVVTDHVTDCNVYRD